jgi:manganese oxidase
MSNQLMPTTSKIYSCSVFLWLLAALAFAQAPPDPAIVANQNRTPAGKIENGTLTIQLEIRDGTWHPEAEDGPQLFVQAFGEVGKPAQIPAPLMRMPAGTAVHVKVTNKLKRKKATIYGLNTRPGDPKAGVEIAAGASHEFTFLAGAPGTYYYWARTVTPADDDIPYLADAYLNGAFIIDPPGATAPDRIFVINAMFALADVVHKGFEVVTINGKSYPYTEPLEYTEGETVRWRVLNPSFSEHPMHLHGAFYQLLSLGDFESDTSFTAPDRQWVVTQNMTPGNTMMLEWKPEHPGRWLFHCHFADHFSLDERVPDFRLASSLPPSNLAATSHPHEHDALPAMNDMAGLVLAINVKSATTSAQKQAANVATHKLDLVVEPTAAGGQSRTFSCSVREGKKIVASEDRAMGPPIVVTRGELTEITVLNHLDVPTTIHWHGLELDSYYDGVIGGGTGNQITPAIPPGGSFTARFTPNRAGTFIYHTHAPDPNQLTGGVYGALIVLEPGQQFDPEHDKLLMIGSRDGTFFEKQLTLNGLEQPAPLMLSRGVKYRMRVINMAPNLAADLLLGTKEHPASWLAIAKDGADLPSRLIKTNEASLHIASGEAYDFEFKSEVAAELPLQVENPVGHAKVVGKVVVQ